MQVYIPPLRTHSQPPARVTVQQVGRYQLVPENQGTIFLLDSITGRVWRYTRVTPSEADVQGYVDGYVKALERASGRQYSETERKELSEIVRRDEKANIEAMVNPCKGLLTCLVELDRVRLSPSGFNSELLPGK